MSPPSSGEKSSQKQQWSWKKKRRRRRRHPGDSSEQRRERGAAWPEMGHFRLDGRALPATQTCSRADASAAKPSVHSPSASPGAQTPPAEEGAGGPLPSPKVPRTLERVGVRPSARGTRGQPTASRFRSKIGIAVAQGPC